MSEDAHDSGVEPVGDSLHWRPNRPCRPEVLQVIRFIRDSLEAQELLHVTEQDEENPDVFLCQAFDEDEHINAGLVGWDDAEERVRFYAYDPVRIRHNEAEGVDRTADSEWCWEAKGAMTFVDHLNGTVREVMESARAQVGQLGIWGANGEIESEEAA